MFLSKITSCGLTSYFIYQITLIVPDASKNRKWLFLLFIPIYLLAMIQHTPHNSKVGNKKYTEQHPIEILVQKAQANFESMMENQSKSLGEAIRNYIQRYKRQPPPAFDKWFMMAQQNDYLLFDEFDTIMESLEPFWSIDPTLLRQKIQSVKEEMVMIRVDIRDHEITTPPKQRKERAWQSEIIHRWLGKPGWLEILPDMTFWVNRYDEPRGMK